MRPTAIDRDLLAHICNSSPAIHTNRRQPDLTGSAPKCPVVRVAHWGMAGLETSGELWRLADVYDCGYREGDLSLGNYRLDPAPEGIHPRLTETDALKVFSEGPFGDQLAQAVPRAFARFGLFSGADVFDAADGDLGPSTEVRLRPAWLVVIPGLKVRTSGPPPGPGSLPREKVALDSWGTAVVYDDTGTRQYGYIQSSADPHVR